MNGARSEGARRGFRALVPLALGAAALAGCPGGSQGGALGPNLFVNPTFDLASPDASDRPLGWTTDAWGTNRTTFTWDQAGRDGGRSARVEVAARVNGNAAWVPDWVSVEPGASYLYQDVYRGSADSRLLAQFESSTGVVTYLTLDTPAASADWGLARAVVKPPAGTTRVSVRHLLEVDGTLQVDEATLAKMESPDLTSGVPNGSLEQRSSVAGMPLAWQTGGFGDNHPLFYYLSSGHGGLHSIKLTVSGYASGDAKWYFSPVAVTGRARYRYSDFYRADAVSFATARFILADGSYDYLKLTDLPASSGWRQAQLAFTAPPDAVAVTIFRGLTSNGSLQLDDVALSPLPAVPLVAGVPNGGLEEEAFPGAGTPAGWATISWGSAGAAFAWATTGHHGSRSARVEMTAAVPGSAAAWYYDPQPVVPRQSYTLSHAYRANLDSAVVARVLLDDGGVSDSQLLGAFAAADWTPYSAIFATPPGARFLTTFFRVSGVGVLQVDDVSLQPTNVTPFRRGLVTLTFDDAFKSDYSLAWPALRQRGLVATHYVITGLVGQEGRLSWDMVGELADAGEQIASHTVTHPDLTTLGPAELQQELGGSRAALEAHGLGPMVDFASPYGAYNAATLAAIEATYGTHRAVDTGYNVRQDWQRWRLQVQNVRSTTTAEEVDGWVAQAALDRSWLILVYHEVTEGEPGSIYVVRRADLEAQLDAIAERGVPVVTLRQAMEELGPQAAAP